VTEAPEPQKTAAVFLYLALRPKLHRDELIPRMAIRVYQRLVSIISHLPKHNQSKEAPDVANGFGIKLLTLKWHPAVGDAGMKNLIPFRRSAMPSELSEDRFDRS
jgi:hypothetical protein